MMLLTIQDLRGVLEATFPRMKVVPLILTDDEYLLYAHATAAEDFRNVAREVQGFLGPWEKNVRDCNKFSLLVLAQMAMAHVRQTKMPYGLAIGMMSYFTRKGEKHCVNVLVTGRWDAPAGPRLPVYRVRAFEPQTGEEIMMTPAEKNSVNWIMI